MIMVSEITSYNYTSQARPSWGNADNYSQLLNRVDTPRDGMLQKLSEMLRNLR